MTTRPNLDITRDHVTSIIGGTGLCDIASLAETTGPRRSDRARSQNENAHPCGACAVALLTPVIWQVRPRHARRLTKNKIESAIAEPSDKLLIGN